MNKPLGGYFELTIPEGKSWHPSAVRLNSARNALRYYLARKNIRQIYLPEYICDSVIRALRKDDVKIQFYPLDKRLMPIVPEGVSALKPLLIVNYFGMNISREVPLQHKIVDNSQAFFLPAPEQAPAIYSPRKFFGVADGAYLYGCSARKGTLKASFSWSHYSANLKRMELSPEEGLQAHRQNEERLEHEPVSSMSVLTERLLRCVNYQSCKTIRERNFSLLHTRLNSLNRLELVDPKPSGPMAYPFLAKSNDLTQYLRSLNIFCPTYWSGVLSRSKPDSWATQLVKQLTPLPIDHRLNDVDITRISMAVETFCRSKGKPILTTAGAENE